MTGLAPGTMGWGGLIRYTTGWNPQMHLTKRYLALRSPPPNRRARAIEARLSER
jgi:hypothetical protein